MTIPKALCARAGTAAAVAVRRDLELCIGVPDATRIQVIGHRH